MSATLIDQWTEDVHHEFHEHPGPKLRLSNHCERCRNLALRLLEMQAQKLIEIDAMDAEELSFTRERLVN